MKSLNRTLFEAESALNRGEFNNEFQEQEIDGQFGTPLGYNNNNHGLPMASHAQFPMPEGPAIENFTFSEPIYSAEPMFSIENLPHHAMSMPEPATDPFGCYVTGPQEHHHSVDGAMTTFPSQLLPGGHNNLELTPQAFQPQEFTPSEVDAGSQSPPDPMESRFKSPPPPSDIAARRSKRRPAALGTTALRDKTSTGPKTANIPRPLGSPSVAMRRVSSVNGSLNVLAGRIQKFNQPPQRSPLQRHFSEGGMTFLEQNAQNIQHMPMPMLSASWFNNKPPTPNSPREMMQQQNENTQQKENIQQEHLQQFGEDFKVSSSSSPSGSELSYIFNRAVPGCFTTNGLTTNMASPPETPAHPGGLSHWNFDVPDDAQLTPGFSTSFAAEPHLQMPKPQYVSPLAASQPPTPAFSQFAGFPYVHASPGFEIPGDSPGVDYSGQYFGTSSVSSYPTVSSAQSSPEVPKTEKTYHFSNTTQKDFHGA
jgi:hypothetical protein